MELHRFSIKRWNTLSTFPEMPSKFSGNPFCPLTKSDIVFPTSNVSYGRCVPLPASPPPSRGPLSSPRWRTRCACPAAPRTPPPSQDLRRSMSFIVFEMRKESRRGVFWTEHRLLAFCSTRSNCWIAEWWDLLNSVKNHTHPGEHLKMRLEP